MKRLFLSKNVQQLSLKLICENNKIKEIKIFPELIGKNLCELYKKDKIYYISSVQLKEIVIKELNKNIPLL